MADNHRPSLRLRPSEQRSILLLGDLIASTAAVVGAIYTWYRYNIYVLVLSGMTIGRAEKFLRLDGSFFTRVPAWFYILPIVWLLLMIELYEPHIAANWRRILRGIAIAAIVGLLGYSLVFMINQDPNSLPRIGVGAFLLYASLLTLGWRALYIRLYTSSGLMRRVLVVGAGKAGHTLADVYHHLNPPPFVFLGFIDDDPRKKNKNCNGLPVIGPSQKLIKIIEDYPRV